MEEEKITTIKGFDSELKCRGFQYEVGKTYTIDGKIKLCGNGFHAIREDVNPLSVFDFYAPSIGGKTSRYCIVECSGEILRDDDKICCSKITIIEELSVKDLIVKQQEWAASNCDHSKEGGDWASLCGGNRASLRGGNWASLYGGDGASLCGGDGASLCGGDRASLRGGNRASLRGGNEASLRGGYGASLYGGDWASLRGGNRASLRGGDEASLCGGDEASLCGGNEASLRGGNEASLCGGNRASLRGGDGASLCGGNGSKFRGTKWAVFAVEIVEYKKITGLATAIVDGEKIKADTWYQYKGGEWAECEGDEIPSDEIFK